MSTIEHMIEVTAPAREAEREWREFMYRLLIGHYRVADSELEWTPADDSEAQGTVRFEPIDDLHTRVRVNVEASGSQDEVSSVERHVQADLEQYKSFLEGRSEREMRRAG